MNCDRCGQRVNEVPACEHRFVGQAADGTLRCTYCGHNFGPVRELIAAKECPSMTLTEKELLDQIATLTRERDEAKGESEQYKKMLHGNSPSKVQYNAMVDDVGAALGYVSWSLKTWSMLMNEIRQIRADSATFVRERDEAVRERDEAKGLLAITTGQFDAMKKLADNAVKDRDEANRLASHYTSLVITVRDERDAARARIAELEKERTEARKERDKAICDAGIAKSHADYLERASEVFGVRSFVVHANGTWEWRKG
jgi:chromosome segregation ATPase